MKPKTQELVGLDLALKRAHDLTAETKQTACVFVRRTTRAGNPVESFASGSAYAPPPKGYKLHAFVSVSGLVRLVPKS